LGGGVLGGGDDGEEEKGEEGEVAESNSRRDTVAEARKMVTDGYPPCMAISMLPYVPDCCCC